MTQDSLHVDLLDNDLLVEVELTTTLMAAANLTDAALSVDQIDALLGVGVPALSVPRGPVASAVPAAAPTVDLPVLAAERV